MKKRYTIIVFVIAVLAAYAAHSKSMSPVQQIIGKGSQVKERRTLPPFNRIEVRDAGNVYLSQGKIQIVKVSAQQNIIKHLITQVNDHTLIIRDDSAVMTDHPINYYITIPELVGVMVRGSGDVKGKTLFYGHALNIETKGSGDVSLQGEFESVHLNSKGSNNVILSGKATELMVETKGSGNIDTKHFLVNSATIHAFGSGDVWVNATANLSATLQGSGDIFYMSNPAKKSLQVHGSGEIRNRS